MIYLCKKKSMEDKKQKIVETVIRVVIAVLSAVLGALAQTSCSVLPGNTLSILGF